MRRLHFDLKVNGKDFGFYYKINQAISAMKSFEVANVSPKDGNPHVPGTTILLAKNRDGISIWSWWTTTPLYLTALGDMGWKWLKVDQEVDWK